MMFGLSSLVYVRDYVQGLQSQHNQSSCAHASDEIGARNFWGFSELPESKERDQRRQNVVVDASSAKLGSFMTHEFSPRNRTSKPLGFIENNLDQNKTCFQTCDELVQNGNLLKQPYSLFDSACSGRPQENIASSERFGSLTHDHGSELPQVSSSTVQQRKVEDDWKLRNFKKRATRSTAFRAITRDQSLPQRHVSPLSPALRNGERTSGPIAQSGSKLRRLSPLRESSGNIHRSAEIEQQSIGKHFSFLRPDSSLYTMTSCAKDTEGSQISLTPIKAIR
jgi:hypothetical protein